MKKTGGYELIQLINYFLGEDIAIFSCKILVDFINNDYCYHCEKFVKLYLTDKGPYYALRHLEKNEIFEKIRENIEKEELDPATKKNIYTFLDILERHYVALVNILKEENKIYKFTLKVISEIKNNSNKDTKY